MADVAEFDLRTPPAGEGANRRAAFRIEVACPVRLFAERAVAGTDDWSRAPGGRCLDTVTEDVSSTGVRVRLPASLRPYTKLTLRLGVGDCDEEMLAEVRHTHADSFGVAAGLEYKIVTPPTRAHITRFIAAEERRRLPNVRVMYGATCAVAGEREQIEGSTQECTPNFVRLLLHKAVAPATKLSVRLTITGTPMQLAGNVVTCRRAGDLWSAGVQLDGMDATAAHQWTDLVRSLRATAR